MLKEIIKEEYDSAIIAKLVKSE